MNNEVEAAKERSHLTSIEEARQCHSKEGGGWSQKMGRITKVCTKSNINEFCDYLGMPNQVETKKGRSQVTSIQKNLGNVT